MGLVGARVALLGGVAVSFWANPVLSAPPPVRATAPSARAATGTAPSSPPRAPGCTLELAWGEADYRDIQRNDPLVAAFRRNAEALGREFFPLEKLPSGIQGSTDLGNVSYRVPAIHPMLAAAPPQVTIHHPEFAKWAGSELGDAAAIDGAKALAMTALDFACDAQLRRRAREAFEAGPPA